MRFKVDENLHEDVAEVLRAEGHDAHTVRWSNNLCVAVFGQQNVRGEFTEGGGSGLRSGTAARISGKATWMNG